MDLAIRRVIEAIHTAPFRCVLAVTGGGTQAAALLLNVPGGSRTILEVLVPYGAQALADFLGGEPESFCSAETSVAMARRARERACWLAPSENVLGLGCTASVVSDRPKRGEHRFHVATHSDLHTAVHSLVLTKDARDREAEEAVVDGVILNALAEALGVADRIALTLLPGEEIQSRTEPAKHPLAQLLNGKLARLCVQTDD